MGGLILIIPTFALSLWIFISTFRSLARNEVDPVWRKRVIVLLLLGIAAGIWFAFFREYGVRDKLRLHGFPIPTNIQRFQDGAWKTFDPPALIQTLARIADLLAGPAIALLPIKFAAFIKQVKVATGRKP